VGGIVEVMVRVTTCVGVKTVVEVKSCVGVGVESSSSKVNWGGKPA